MALTDGDGPDPVSARLAGAVADLTIVDFLPDELTRIEEHPLATISAPIFDGQRNVVMSVSAQPYKQLTLKEVERIGSRVLAFAEHASSLIAEHVSPTATHRVDRSR